MNQNVFHGDDRESPDASPVFRLIRRVRRLLRSSWMATGLALSLAMYLGVLLAAACLDLLAPLWPTMRLIALLLAVVPSVWAFVTGVVRPLFRRLSNAHVARRIETRLPGVHNRLVSCVDLAEHKQSKGHSPEFYRRLISEALHRIRNFRPASVVDFGNLRRSGAALAIVAALFIVSWIVFSDRLPTAMARIFHPFADIPPETGVKFVVKPGNATVLRGDDIDVMAEVTKGQPRDLRIELAPQDGSGTIWHDLETHGPGEPWRLKLHGLENSFAYRVHGGGTWSPQYEIKLVDRPRLVEARAVLHYPDYLQLGDEGPQQLPTLEATGPETSAVEVQVEAEGDVAEGEIQLLEATWEPVAVTDREERVWFEDRVPENAVSEGVWTWETEKHGRPTHTEPAADGVHGHLFHTARVGFQVEADECLFAWVYLAPEARPRTIMLQWHDGKNWEHRAYWGEDQIGVGQPDTPSRRLMGPLPPVGEWVRLEVPAKAVDLGDKAIKGMGFMLNGGQCYWHRGGAIQAPTRDERKLIVKETFALRSAEPGRWSGRFSLSGEGFYRVELRNELKIANQSMKEARYLAVPDEPPQISLERPGSDITLSQPQKLPLAIAVYDDFAIKHVKLLASRGEDGAFRETAAKKYDEKLTRSDTAILSLDLVPFSLKPGDQVRYRALVEDRKGQVAETRDFVVRIADGNNAADKQLARYEQQQDALQERLAKLIEEQTKVAEQLESLEKKYEPLERKLAQAESQAREEAQKAAQANPQQPPPTAPPELKLDEATSKELAELRNELAQTAGPEEQNARVGKQLANELNQAVKQAEAMKTLPAEIVSEMKAAQETFDELAARPLEQLAQQMRQAANADKRNPHVEQLAKAAERVKQELQASAERLKALQQARQRVPSGLEEALARLRQKMLEQQAGMAARGLEDLRDMLAELREQLQEFEGEQSGLLDATSVVPDVMLEDLMNRQTRLDQRAHPPLAEAKQLLAGDQMQRIEPKMDAAQPEAKAGEAMADAEGSAETAEKAMDKTPPQLRPALGGAAPKLDPQVAAKRPQMAADAEEPPVGSKQAERRQLAEGQFDQLMELDLAEQSLGSDQKMLESLMEQLNQALADSQSGAMDDEMEADSPGAAKPKAQGAAGKPSTEKMSGKPGEAGEPPPSPQQPLDDLLHSPALQQAMAMAQRLQQAQAAQQSSQQAPARPTAGKSLGNLQLTTSSGDIMEADLAALDPATRAILLKMQPQLRQELLQGMHEQGPEGYRKFIQDYFQRLSTAEGAK
ncbi:MAG TPA: hypothetical protein VHC19_14995 [Pirellulales bacterium]|nr:hypothetical protein [Pirellulales bacterium]